MYKYKFLNILFVIDIYFMLIANLVDYYIYLDINWDFVDVYQIFPSYIFNLVCSKRTYILGIVSFILITISWVTIS